MHRHSTAALVGYVEDRVNYKIGLLVYKCLHGLAPGYLSEQFNFHGSRQHALIIEVGSTTVRPTDNNKDTGSTRVLLRLVCWVELTPADLLDPGLSLYSYLIFSQSINFLYSFLYFIIIAFFTVRANVMFISWRVQMSELN